VALARRSLTALPDEKGMFTLQELRSLNCLLVRRWQESTAATDMAVP
jgi:hypothetical protein